MLAVVCCLSAEPSRNVKPPYLALIDQLSRPLSALSSSVTLFHFGGGLTPNTHRHRTRTPFIHFHPLFANCHPFFTAPSFKVSFRSVSVYSVSLRLYHLSGATLSRACWSGTYRDSCSRHFARLSSRELDTMMQRLLTQLHNLDTPTQARKSLLTRFDAENTSVQTLYTPSFV